MKFLVNFVIAGVQKGGTSALAELLGKNHRIFMASPKELHYFDQDENYIGDIEYKKYHSYFAGCARTQIAGEATPMYMYSYDAPRRMWEYNKKMKLIFILRNPIERAYSAWNMERYRNIENLAFIDALKSEIERRRMVLPSQHRNFSYVDRGYYSEQIRRVWNYFPKSQTFFIKTDDLMNNQQMTLNKVWDFLNVPSVQFKPIAKVFSTPYQKYMAKEEYEYLYKLFKLEICVLEDLLGWDCSDWKQPVETQ